MSQTVENCTCSSYINTFDKENQIKLSVFKNRTGWRYIKKKKKTHTSSGFFVCFPKR